MSIYLRRHVSDVTIYVDIIFKSTKAVLVSLIKKNLQLVP